MKYPQLKVRLAELETEIAALQAAGEILLNARIDSSVPGAASKYRETNDGVQSFNSARRPLSGIEAMNMIRKGQVNEIAKGVVSLKSSLLKYSLGLLLRVIPKMQIVCP